MKKETTNHEILISRYFSGESTPEEVRELSEWLSGNPDHLTIFEEYHKTWLLSTSDAIETGTDAGREWEIISGKIRNTTIKPRSGKLVKLPARNTIWKAIAAAVVVFMVAGAVMLLLPRNQRVITAGAETLAHTLPDGSFITLNAGAEIRYDPDFGSENRSVSLKGEALFEVQKDAGKPFVVSDGKARIEVLGTVFSVDAPGEGKTSISLAEGKVALYFSNAQQDKKYLEPGEAAIMSSGSREITVKPNDDPNYLAWKTRLITFENTSMERVAQTLNKVYHIKIRFEDPSIAGCRLTASFSNQPLESVLNVITTTLDLSYKINKDAVLISGTGCN